MTVGVAQALLLLLRSARIFSARAGLWLLVGEKTSGGADGCGAPFCGFSSVVESDFAVEPLERLLREGIRVEVSGGGAAISGI